MKSRTTQLLLAILIGGLIVRFYGFSNPIADWHSWRQADTSAVSRNFIQKGFDIFSPRFDDLSNIPSGLDNPQGYRFVEFPLYNILQAGLFNIIGIFSLEEWGRLVTIFFSIGAVYFLYRIVKEYSNEQIAIFSAFFYAFLPFSVFYGRVILPDTAMVSTALGGIFFFMKWIHEKKSHSTNWVYALLSLLIIISSLLFKPYAIFFAIPLFAIAYNYYGLKLFKQWIFYIFAFVAILPLLWWRHYIQAFPEGVPANDWLFNGNGIRFRPAFFRWIGYERVVKLIAGYGGAVLLLVGLTSMLKLKGVLVFAAFILSSILYLTIFATGNVQHDYYQIVILPTLAILMGVGASSIYKLQTKFGNVLLSRLLLSLIIIVMFFFSWKIVEGYYWINNPEIVSVGKELDKILPKDALVVAPYGGDTSFLYNINRNGWPSFQDGIPSLVEKGADYLVIINPKKEDEGIGDEYKLIIKKPTYLLFDLNQKP